MNRKKSNSNGLSIIQLINSLQNEDKKKQKETKKKKVILNQD